MHVYIHNIFFNNCMVIAFIVALLRDLLNEVLKNLVQSGLRHFDILCTEREMGSKIEGRRDMEAQVMSYMHAINPDVQVNVCGEQCLVCVYSMCCVVRV